jgi:PAS domain S-box-containing protein
MSLDELSILTLVEHLPLGVCMIDRDGQLQLANTTTARMLGVSDGEALAGRSFIELFPAANRDYMTGLIARAIAGERIEVEYTLLVGSQRHVFASTLIPIAGTDAAVRTLLAVTQDLTEQLEMRLDAELERDRLGAAIQSSNDAIIMFDLERRLTLANHAWTTLFGLSDRELIGLTDRMLLDRIKDRFEQPDQVLAMLDTLFAGLQNEASGEVAIRRPEYHMLVWYSVPMRTSAGTSLGRLFIFRDVTRERKADRIKAEFVSIVSHELRTPLTSIKGFTELILEGDAGPIAPEVRELLEIVQCSTDQLVVITNDILETSRIDAGRVKINPQPLDAAAIIHLSADSFGPLLADKQQTLALDLPPDLPLVWADRDRLPQILSNLISNAHKYTPAQGHIRIHAYLAEDLGSRHASDLEANSPWLIVCVTDDGIGIAPKDQEQLFSRFYRVNNPIAQGVGGTGLGLNITRSLVELHGGRIWLESELGHGSTFYFSLPTVPRPAEHAASATSSQPIILIVEADNAVARLIERRLARAGHKVLRAARGQEALDIAHAQPIALAMIGQQLPDMDGFALLERLRAAPGASELSAILVAVEQDDERASDPAITRYLALPIDERRLVDVVEAALASFAPR